MLVHGSKLQNFPVLSLHVGDQIARTIEPVIDPNDLKVIAFYVDGPLVGREAGNLLETRSVREFSNMGMIVDSIDDFVNKGDVIKLDKILDLNFKLNGLKVITKKKTKLGKVIDFTVDTTTFEVMQIVVQRPPMKAFIDPELIISRKEIVEITDNEIIIKDEEDKIRKKAVKEDFVPNFVNPFREPNFAPTESRTLGGQDN